jgi:hypothetical protein
LDAAGTRLSIRYRAAVPLDIAADVGSFTNMKARSVMDSLVPLSERAFARLVIWRVPQPVRGSTHNFKYRLALVVDRVCVMRYDNEAGKGDHKHIGDTEIAYEFTSIKALLADFWADAKPWRTAS